MLSGDQLAFETRRPAGIWIGFFEETGVSDYTDCLMRAGSDQEAAQQCANQFTDRVEDQFSITVTPTP